MWMPAELVTASDTVMAIASHSAVLHCSFAEVPLQQSQPQQLVTPHLTVHHSFPC
jgi:hypothetical protein